MNWYKMSDGNLVNLGLATDIRIKSDWENSEEIFFARVIFSEENSTAFPERFKTKAEAVKFLESLYEEMPV